jgi:hypothetical protein
MRHAVAFFCEVRHVRMLAKIVLDDTCSKRRRNGFRAQWMKTRV